MYIALVEKWSPSMGVSSYEDEKLISYMKTKYLCHYAVCLNGMCRHYTMTTFNGMIDMFTGHMIQDYIRMQMRSQKFQIVFTNNIYRYKERDFVDMNLSIKLMAKVRNAAKNYKKRNDYYKSYKNLRRRELTGGFKRY